MTSLTTETPEFLHAVRTALVGQGTGDTEVLDVEVSQREDEAGEITWWLTLLLPRPAGNAWSAEVTGELKRSARRSFDAVAQDRGLALDSPTVVVVTTRQAPTSQIAAEEDLPADAGAAREDTDTDEAPAEPADPTVATTSKD